MDLAAGAAATCVAGVAGAAAAAGAVAAADAAAADAPLALAPPADADLLTPPCPLHAPRSPCTAVVSFLQVTTALLDADAVGLARAGAAAAGAAAPAAAPLALPTDADLLTPPCPLH